MKTLQKITLFSITVFTAISSTSCKQAQKEEKQKELNIVEATAPDADVAKQQGYALDGLDHGLMQSPINIMTNDIKDLASHQVKLHYNSSKELVKNLGHTIQVNYEDGNTISFDEKVFDFKQFHFHTPSEHLVDGITYPMEMHMVHTFQGQNDKEAKVYLVVGALFKEGKENPFLNEFMAAIPKNEGEENAPKEKKLNMNDFLDQATDLHYYNYQGSLTTPPYTETVTWLIVKHVFEASAAQIQQFNKLEGNNARHIQALYGREVSSQ